MKRLTIAALLIVVTSAASAADLAGNAIFIPVAGRMPGALNTEWRTDLTVHNPSRRFEAAGEIIYHADDGSEQRRTFALAPLATIQYRDLLANLGYVTSHGLVRIVGAPGVRVAARARIYNAANPAGEFGQDVPGVPLEQLSRWTAVAGLSSTAGNRSNVGVSNPHDVPVPISVSWFDGDGDFHGSVMTIDVPARSVLQINDIFDWTGHPKEIPLSIVVRSSDASRPVFLWSSIVRNDTGDAVFVAGQDVLD